MPCVQLLCDNLSHKFSKHWLFKDFSYRFYQDKLYYLTAPNGAGKTTLLRILAGELSPLNGEIKLFRGKRRIPSRRFGKFIAFQSPIMEIPEVLKVFEIAKFYEETGNLEVTSDDFLSELSLLEYRNHKISELSSGTKQRLMVGLALFSQREVLILDEPTANFDKQNAEKIIRLLKEKSSGKIVIIASNLEREKHLLESQFSEVIPVSF